MNKLCDLHTHSIFSDGTYTPGEIIDEAIEIGLSAVALCDHNTVDGVPDFISAAKGKNIEAVSGVEFSVNYNKKELHLLALYVPEDKLSDISDLVTEVTRRKEESNIALIKSLNSVGFDIDYLTIKNKSPNGKINRVHVATELTEKGYTTSITEAFDTVLSKEAGHYIEPKRFTIFEMIEAIKKLGAVSVLAHPFLNLTEEELLEFLPVAKQCGLVGMECLYSLYDENLVAKSFELADKFGLLPSGGSDFHGANKPDIKLGVGKDNLSIPYEFAENLKILAK